MSKSKTKGGEWREMDLSELKPADYNPRDMKAKARAGLNASLDRWGLIQNIVWNKRTGNIVGGHRRVEELQALGETRGMVRVVDVSLKEEKRMNISLNNPHISGDYTDDLQAILLESQADDAGLFESLVLDDLLEPQEPPDDSEDGGPGDVPSDPVTKPGDLWILGDHYLLCGDSTKKEDVGRLFARVGEDPFIMVTDPPYGVNYDPGWRDENFGNADRAAGKVSNDDTVSWLDAWKLFTGIVAYAWHGAKGIGRTQADLESSGLICRTLIVWAKDRLVVSRGHYHSQFESAWYAVRKGKSSRWSGDRSQSTVWKIDTPRKSETGHGTQKPIACMLRPIINHGSIGDVVYDPFSGVATTIMAAMRAERRCAAIEIDPGYVDASVERWENESGEKAVRVKR